MQVHGTQYYYTIKLPDGKKVKLWFIGKLLETVLDAYNIPYTKGKKERIWK